MGEGCEISSSVEITVPERLQLGSHVFINRGCHLATEGGLTIESHSILGPWVLVMTSMHAYRGARLLPYDERELVRPVVIGRACWIGARAILLPGVKLGTACVVGAGSVVTKSWPDGAVIAGNPAREVARRDPEELGKLLASEAFYLREKQRVGLKKRFIPDG